MPQKQWVVVAPLLVLLGITGSLGLNPVLTRGADPRIANERFYTLERELGYHLYAPTWLPYGGRVGIRGAMRGQVRILQDFTDEQDRSLCILSQERREPVRDRYHHNLFQEQAEATVELNGKQGFFITGNGGERRLFWNEAESAVILSSCVLSDDEMVQIARAVR